MKFHLSNLLLFSCFLLNPFCLHAIETQKEEQIKPQMLNDSHVIAQLKIADSISGINGEKAIAILDKLLANQITNITLLEEVILLKQNTLSWLSRHEEAVDFLTKLIDRGNPSPKLYLALSHEYRYLFDYSKSISSAFEALKLYKENEDFIGIVDANNKLITAYGEIGMYKDALLLFNENILICNSIKYEYGLVQSYIEYGKSFVFENPPLAFEYLQSAMQIAESSTGKLSCLVSNYLIRYYINANQLQLAKKEANKYFRKCLLSNYLRDSNVHTLMAHIYSLEINIDSTIYFNTQALETRINSGNKRMIASSYINLAGNYLAKKDIKKANQYLIKAEEIVTEINDPEMLLTYYRNKIKYFDYVQDYQNAYFFSKKEIEINRKLTDLRQQSVLAKLKTSFGIQQKNILLEKELETRKTRTRFILYVLSIIAFILGVLYLIFQIKKKNYSYIKLTSRTSRIEQKLIISNKERLKLQAIFEYSVTGILILDNFGKVQYANRKSYELLNMPNEENILYRPFLVFFEAQNQEKVNEAFLNVFNEKNENKSIKVQIINNNKIHWLDISFAPLVFDLNEDNILVTLIDVTQEVINIGQEQEQKQILKTLLNSVTESILFLERNGNIKALNNTAAERLKSSPEKLIETNYFDSVPKSLKDKRLEMFEKAIQLKKPLIEMEMVGKYNNLISMYPNINALGEVDYVSEFVQDISERRQAEEQIDNLKQRILRSQMNPHFIFNSLTSIQSFVIRNEAESASKYLNSFARLIRLILESSRHDYISLKNEIDILNYYLEIQKMRFSDNFTFSFEIDKNLNIEKINIPPMLAQPFIENAIEHGIQHLDKNGELVIKFVKEGNRLLIELRDNGIGRDASELLNKENIFASKSLSTKIINDRLNALNKYAKDGISYNIIDLKDDNNFALGTKVIISIPIDNY